jgi:glutamate dehydrogenase (NAD(P)+)
MHMAEREMAWFVEANGNRKSATGKPKSMGGLPHELGSTGFGVNHSALVAAGHAGLDPAKATVAIEGFGNVGWFAAKFMSEGGFRLVAVSDSRGVIHNPEGIDFEKLGEVKKETGSVINYKQGKVHRCEDLLDIGADILITAAVPDLIRPGDVARLKFGLIVEGSNIPMTHEVEERCHSKGILVVPDFVANAGGVISSYVEHIGGSEREMFRMVEEKITKNTKMVLEKAEEIDDHPRDAALGIVKERVRKGDKSLIK